MVDKQNVLRRWFERRQSRYAKKLPIPAKNYSMWVRKAGPVDSKAIPLELDRIREGEA